MNNKYTNLINKEIKLAKTNETFKIIDVEVDFDNTDLVVKLENNKLYLLKKAISAGFLVATFDLTETDTILEKDIKLEKLKLEELQKLENERIARELQEKNKQRLLDQLKQKEEDFRKDLQERVDLDTDPIDWLKENVVSIRAEIPEYLENVFDYTFGKNAERHIIDSRRKTSGGFSMKFGPSFSLRVKKDVMIPASLVRYFRPDRTIHNTAFISTLVRDHDFKFGKNK